MHRNFRNDLTNAMNLMDADGNGHVTEDEFLVWYLGSFDDEGVVSKGK